MSTSCQCRNQHHIIFNSQRKSYNNASHLDTELRALSGVPHVARTDDIDAEPEDEPVHCDDHREGAPLRRADGVLELFDVAQQRQRAPRAV
jgi:hypothetical protein